MNNRGKSCIYDQILKRVKANRGSAMIMVLCCLLLFSIMGITLLIVAFAPMGSGAQRVISHQANEYAQSLATALTPLMERGTLDKDFYANLIVVNAQDSTMPEKPVLKFNFEDPAGHSVEYEIRFICASSKESEETLDTPNPELRGAKIHITCAYRGKKSYAISQFAQISTLLGADGEVNPNFKHVMYGG